MSLTENETDNLKKDGVFGNVENMNRLNTIMIMLQSRGINITYNDIKEETQTYVDEHYPNRLIIDLTEDEKNNVSQNVINKLEDMILEPLIPADNNWVGDSESDVLLGGRKRKSRRGTKRKRGSKRKRRGSKRRRK